MKKGLSLLLVACLAFVGATAAKAAAFPDKKKPINFVVPYNAGGSADLSARPIAEQVSKILGVNVVIMNRPGAGGSVAAAEVARGKADGYTYLLGSTANLTIVPYNSKLSYNLNSFEPVAMLSDTPLVIACGLDLPVKNLREFLDYAKANPGKVRYASPGASSTQQLTMESLAQLEGITWTHMPVGGGAQCTAAVLGKHQEATCLTTTDLQGNYNAKSLRFLAIAAKERQSTMPDVPTLKECGFDLAYGVHYSLVAKKGTPKEAIEIIGKAVEEALKTPYVIDAYKKFKTQPLFMNATDLAVRLQADDVKFKKVLDSISKLSNK